MITKERIEELRVLAKTCNDSDGGTLWVEHELYQCAEGVPELCARIEALEGMLASATAFQVGPATVCRATFAGVPQWEVRSPWGSEWYARFDMALLRAEGVAATCSADPVPTQEREGAA